jgi:hypothetical protein
MLGLMAVFMMMLFVAIIFVAGAVVRPTAIIAVRMMILIVFLKPTLFMRALPRFIIEAHLSPVAIMVIMASPIIPLWEF